MMMTLSFLGYMGSGKSRIAGLLGEKLHTPCIDLDKELSKRLKSPISTIFETRGELFFRKQERELLEELLAKRDDAILSLGGGTPVYYNNMELINASSTSVYLRAKVPTLAERLAAHKEKRPLIARISDEDLPEFIAKHLFERSAFYSKAQIIVDTDGKTPEEVCGEVMMRLQDHR